MERHENESRKRAETATVGLYCLSAQEDQVFGREARVQALHEVAHTMCVQGHSEEGCAPHRLYGYAGQKTQEDGRSRYQTYTEGEQRETKRHTSYRKAQRINANQQNFGG